MLENFINKKESEAGAIASLLQSQTESNPIISIQTEGNNPSENILSLNNIEDDIHLMDDRTNEEIKKSEEDVDLYNINNFSL
jgi:hypothetical protein